MPVIRSFGALQSVNDQRWPSSVINADTPSYGLFSDYAQIYATQPNVRICVDFLARNIAELGFHVFRRVSDTDRVRLPDHQLADWLDHPNPYTSRYRLFESYAADLALYFNAYLMKVRLESEDRIGLVRLPPGEMDVEGGLLPSQFVWTANGIETPFATTDIVYANGYNPLNALMGLSPIETIRRILAEDVAAGIHRERYWRESARMQGVIERPKDAPKWDNRQKDLWYRQWKERYTGPNSIGSTPVLEDGMSWKQVSWSAKESEYLAARKLTREECASIWHIPLPFAGILDYATYSNIKEQHKQLYSDCLGPWLKMITEALLLQLLPDCRDRTNIYGEFNIFEKLKGSFEEQSNSLKVAVGRPFMTANEARARLNLPRIDDSSADELAPQQGGPSNAPDTRPSSGTREQANEPVAQLVRTHWARQAARLAKLPIEARADALDQERCTHELAEDLMPLMGHAEALRYAARVTDDTYLLLLERRDAFAAQRDVREWWEARHARAA